MDWSRVTISNAASFFAGYCVYAGVFAIWGYIWSSAAPPRWRGIPILVAGAALAVVVEFGQGLEFVGRGSDPADAFVASIGVAFGVTAHYLSSLRDEGRKSGKRRPMDPSDQREQRERRSGT